jgi:MoaA/NifB/PqqE/SkfB family radical SAM enzyme
MVPVIYSNGSSLVPDVAEFYRSRNASLVIAIDSLKPSVYSTVTGTGPNMLEVVLRNLGRLREIFSSTVEELEGQRLVRLALNMTVSSINWDEIEEIKAFAGDDFYFVCNPLARQGNAVGHWPVLMTGDSRELELVQELVQKYSESGGPLTFDGRGLCGYSVNGIGIGPYGHYMTCAYTTRTNGLLGTIRERSLGAAYAIKNAKELSHYQVFGQMPCLVRSASFESFADGLSEHGPAEISRKQQHIMEKSTGSRLVVIR